MIRVTYVLQPRHLVPGVEAYAAPLVLKSGSNYGNAPLVDCRAWLPSVIFRGSVSYG